MNEVLKSSRFWATVVVCICATILAALRVVNGDTVVGAMVGLVAGFGVGKTWRKKGVSGVAVADETSSAPASAAPKPNDVPGKPETTTTEGSNA